MQARNSDLRDLLRSGLTRSLASLGIKVATAGLTYGMYVVLSRTMGAEEYGYFAFGLSLATLLAVGAGMGQQTAILRYWPEEQVAGRPEKSLEAVGAGGALTLLAGGAISLLLLAFAALAGLWPGVATAHLFAAAALIAPLALAEYWSSALRAQGSVWTALLPRDILWRLATPVLVVLLFAAAIPLSGWAALLLTALVLVAALGLQAIVAHRRRYAVAPRTGGVASYWRAHGTPTIWFLIGTVIDSAALNADIIFIGLLLSAQDAGVYFNAFRTAGLLTLFMFAINLVLAPVFARHYHAGEWRKAQAISALTAWSGFVFSVAVFALFAMFGNEVLSLFGTPAGSGYWALVLLSAGLLFDAATGPSRIVMMMTGHERDYVRIFGGIMLAGLVVGLVVIPVFGLVGAAAVNAVARAVASSAIALFNRRHVGIDTSLLGAFRVQRLRDASPGAAVT
ncbi:lipopolysaccharide biosynthesis protein [Devosia sp.]|uniref:lipopolysaccharide biosynthesis protein n=1 Tax=Devosia sp. TaxID=1871048 RepID=UPI0035B489E6